MSLVASAGERFGQSLAVGDFDGDGKDDLAIGAPGQSRSGEENAGVVHVLFGSSSGLTSDNDQLFSQNTSGVKGGDSEAFDDFGESLAAGDFDGDGRDDLAIGSPGEDRDGKRNVGTVNVLYGGNSGLITLGDQHLYFDLSGIKGVAKDFDRFGQTLASGDFDGDGRDDLAIGAPFKDVEGVSNSGSVNVLYGASSGLSLTGDQFWNQNVSGLKDSVEEGDRFGSGLAVGDFDNDGRDDLAIDVSGEGVEPSSPEGGTC